MLFYSFFTLLFFLIHLFIILTTKINIFPELMFYPWLMSKGLHIYRDFGVQHGYFLQLILLPFTLDKSLFMMKSFFIALQMINLFFILRILKKTTNVLGFIIGGALFISLNYYLTDSNLWDEIIVASIYVFIYYLLLQKQKSTKKMIAVGILLGFASFMKPSFMIMIIPVIIVYRSFIPALPILCIWVLSLLYFAVSQNLDVFLNSYIIFNKTYALAPKLLSIDIPFVIRTAQVFGASLVIFLIYRKKLKNNPIILFTLLSALLFFPSLCKINLVPFGIFFSIFVGQLIGKIKKWYLFPFVIFVGFYLIFITQQAKHLYKYLQTNRLPYLENAQTTRIVSKIKSFSLKKNTIYILGNRIEYYYFLDKIPPVWYTIIWKSAIPSFPDIEKRTIREIKKNKVTHIVIPKPADDNYSSFTELKRYIKQTYIPLYEDKDFQLLKIKK